MRRVMIQIVAAAAIIGGVGVAAAGIAQAAPLGGVGGIGDPGAGAGAPGSGSSDPGSPLGGLAGALPLGH